LQDPLWVLQGNYRRNIWSDIHPLPNDEIN